MGRRLKQTKRCRANNLWKSLRKTEAQSKTELQKNADTFDNRVSIMEFLEWINSEDLAICNIINNDEVRETWSPITENSDKLLDKHFGIDSVKLEQERRKLLEEVQA